MKWIEARHLDQWAERTDARQRLSEIVSRLVRASAANISSYRFPSGDSAQFPGYDGRLTAIVDPAFQGFVPEGDSVWEFGTASNYLDKANSDFSNRSATPGNSVIPQETTFVFVTPRRWARANPNIAEWIADKKASRTWKDVRVLDAIALEDWLEQCPAVAAGVAREIIGLLPITGAYSAEEFWQEYSTQFRFRLSEDVLLAGRKEQSVEMIKALSGTGQILRWQGESLVEVLAFAIACMRRADSDVRKFLEARVLILESREAALQLAGSPHLVFLVRGTATDMAGVLASASPVLVPLGRDSLRNADAIQLKRSSTFEMAEALKSMGLREEEAQRRARESDRSLTILARRIPSTSAKTPSWHGNAILIPALLAGAWDCASPHELEVVRTLAARDDYQEYEAEIRRFLTGEDAPLEREGSVWAVRAPVDVFVHLAPLIGEEHLTRLCNLATEVFGEVNPVLALAPEDQPFAQLHGAVPQYSHWIRDGLATTLLIIAALGEASDLQVIGTTPQRFVNELVLSIPGLREDSRIISSLSRELPLLMEAAPDPLLSALEHMLEGSGERMRAVFQDSKASSFLFAHSPHTGLLWALELIAWDPAYLARASLVLARLSEIDPGGSLSNRPDASLAQIFLAWHPSTNAPLRQRLAVIDQILARHSDVGWKLLVRLLPRGHDYGGMPMTPRFREAGASEREVLTRGVVLQSYEEVVRRAVAHAGASPSRWKDILDLLHAFPWPEQDASIEKLRDAASAMNRHDRESLWEDLSKVVRHHRAYPGANWSLTQDRLDQLEALADAIGPKEIVKESLWLFTTRFPELPYKSADHLLQEIEDARRQSVEAILEKEGVSAVLRLAELAEAPRYVGFAFGSVIGSVDGAYDAAVSAFSKGERLLEFVTLLSAAVLERFGEDWKGKVARAYRAGRFTTQQLIRLVLAWPHRRSTWDFMESLNDDVAITFWQSKEAWGIDGSQEDLIFATRKYLEADRAELLVDALVPKVKQIPSDLILEILDQFQKRIVSSPEILRSQMITFDLQQIFLDLQTRSDVPLMELARREYQYLPLLRDSAGLNPMALEIDRYMKENPEFFVQVICDVFRPASQKEKSPPTEEQQARARVGWRLIDGFTDIPGSQGDQIDGAALDLWVSTVRQLAGEADRLRIAEQRIGGLLAHAASDPDDHIWPHRVIRESLEEWHSKEIENGIFIERLNMRGTTTRAYLEGGDQERGLAAQLRTESKAVAEWPRSQKLLLALADYWDQAAKREDLQAKHDEMKDR